MLHGTIEYQRGKMQRAGTHCNTFAISIQRACQVYFKWQWYWIRLLWNDRNKSWGHLYFI